MPSTPPRRKKRTAVVYWLAFTSLTAWIFLLLFPLLPVNRFVPLPGPIKDLYRHLVDDSAVRSDAAPSNASFEIERASEGDRMGLVAGITLTNNSGTPIYLKTGPHSYALDLYSDETRFSIDDHTHPVLSVTSDKLVRLHPGSTLLLQGAVKDTNQSTGKAGDLLIAQGKGRPPIWRAATDVTAGNLACDDCLTTQEIEDVYVLNTGDSLTGDLLVGSGDFGSGSASPDLYVQGNLEVDGTIYGNVAGTVTPGGFTAGSVVFANSSGALAQDNASFFWDDTNNRLGIGTTEPNDSLHVDGGGIYVTADGTTASQPLSYCPVIGRTAMLTGLA